MISLRDYINSATDRRVMPEYNPGSTRDLALKLGLSLPVSLYAVIAALNKLPPASVTFDSGPLTAGYVHASARLYVQSDGGVAFAGDAHEAGVFGEHFLLAVALDDVQDAQGNTPVWPHQEVLAGSSEFGKSDIGWLDSGYWQFAQDNWDLVKKSRYQFVLKARTDAWQLTEGVLLGLFKAIAAAVAVVLVVKCTEGQRSWKCGWRAAGSSADATVSPGDPGRRPGAGLEYRCHCELDVDGSPDN